MRETDRDHRNATYPDLVIYCEGPPANRHSRYVVERARYFRDLDAWMPTRAKVVQVNRDNTVNNIGGPYDHTNWALRCTRCLANTPLRSERIEAAIYFLLHREMTEVPLSAMERAADFAAPRRRVSPELP